MIIRTPMTEADRIRKKIRSIDGKKTKDKAQTVLKSHVNLLREIRQLNRYPRSIQSLMDRVSDDLSSGYLTTSIDQKLEELVKASEDLEQLLDDMMHTQGEATYEKRLLNVLEYLKDFQAKSYSPHVTFYDKTSEKLEDQLKSVAKDIQYRVSKMKFQRKTIVDDITYREKENITKAKALQSMDKNRAEYQTTAKEIEDSHQRIVFSQGSLDLLRKSINSYQLITDLFNQLSLLDQYNKHLKGDGYIKRLVKRLYRKPEELEVLEDTTDLVDVLNQIKAEILDVESIVKPSQTMIFKDAQDSVDEDLIKRYTEMED